MPDHAATSSPAARTGAAQLAGVRAHLAEVAGDDEAFIAELLVEFIALAQATAPTLLAGAAAGPSEALARAAHSLKGAALNVGADVIAGGCRQLEEGARGGAGAAELLGAAQLVAAAVAELAAALDGV
jgi:HPt (histidine-containing phosphotransfer) domain-containing protein